jgi:hypothetical protein
MFESVPGDGDLYLLSRVLHDWEDVPASTVLRNCAHEMGHGARLVLLERILPEQDGALADAPVQYLADLHMLVRTGGRERTREEYDALLARAGLRMEEILPTNTPWSLVLAHRV